MKTKIPPKLKQVFDLGLELYNEHSYLELESRREHYTHVPETKIIIPLDATPIPKGKTNKRLTKAQRKKINLRKQGKKKNEV